MLYTVVNIIIVITYHNIRHGISDLVWTPDPTLIERISGVPLLSSALPFGVEHYNCDLINDDRNACVQYTCRPGVQIQCVRHIRCVGVPTPPRGPLIMSFTSATSVQLEWQPPLHDGGSPLLCYRVFRREMFRTTWTEEATLSTDANDTAPGSAMSCCLLLVNDLMPGNQYEFKVLVLINLLMILFLTLFSLSLTHTRTLIFI